MPYLVFERVEKLRLKSINDHVSHNYIIQYYLSMQILAAINYG